MRFWLFICAALGCFSLAATAQHTDTLSNGDFLIIRDQKGLSAIRNRHDIYPTNYVRANRHFGEITMRYTQNGRRDSSLTNLLTQSFDLRNNTLYWNIRIKNNGKGLLIIDDLFLDLPYNSQGGENPKEIFEQQVIKHHFISGNNSFIFWQRPTGVGPYLLMTPQKGTGLEYFTANRGFQAFIHSAYTSGKIQGSWRQPNTKLTLQPGQEQTYSFVLQWVKDYNNIREKLAGNGLIDVHVMPGMTIPTDMHVKLALHTKVPLNKLSAEFPAQTKITYLGEKQKGYHHYDISFRKLGENKLTLKYNGNENTYLEFFVTEPLETLYKKRASFLVSHQQHKDSTKWYNGLISVWDMKNQVLRGPDNTDGFDGWWGYVLACDDPALGKAPYLAAKNLYYPEQKEIDAIEYYIEHFVWGGLQRTDKETPNPYGIYGTPNWWVNRDSTRRSLMVNDKNQDKMHIWRSYDYPHLMMMYYHMYQIAAMYPDKVHYLDKKGYLERARETAKAYFIYPYQILPWYETYKWGCYNELLIVPLIADLEKEGYKEDADWLRKEWEKKVKYFVYDDPYPFRSEYAVDATAFESSQALAAYGTDHEMKPDSNLWFDKNLQKWYSHPVVTRDSARRFMDRQIQANIALRGWLEPSFYYLGSDFRGKSDGFTLSYMSQMGGWAILDYALHYATEPADYLRLGYASYLSSFALMNTGTAESNYGAWYPGKENDGASGWAFEPQQRARTWIRKEQGRGPWFYDGEIDLGYGGATRAAATIVTNDPVFGLVAYGGTLRAFKDSLQIVPHDGLRNRLYCRHAAPLDITLNRDRFEKLTIGKNFVNATLTHAVITAHTTVITLSGLPAGKYNVQVNGRQTGTITNTGKMEAAIEVLGAGSSISIKKI
ncbi:DUF5695 domain-containing protein [uncultured Chitinophaga sp.]|uniref:DUF5695 domain-containing protein n=1 Tax=uncultured Chitinophaga sp. TaxID=339340 RepID=UPI0025FA642C|nr:DUF5695 domain-containing protein [uncultured Chitinophaga sp.]